MGCVIGGGVLALALALSLASPALAAFPGANGLLAVQPVVGHGVVLVTVNGRVVHRLCTDRKLCGTPRRPRWSPNGQSLVFAGAKIRIVYPDGSCLDCEFGVAPNPAFESGGTTISFIDDGRVTVDGIDTVRKNIASIGGVSDAVWSAGGRLVVVRRGTLWAGRPGRLQAIGPGSQPSWSPNGDRVAAAQRGWVVIIDVRNHHVRRRARGGAPAFSPDGRWIAFVAPDHRLMLVAARGGRPRAVGHIRALSVDWQPRPRGPIAACAAAPGSTVLASDPNAVVTEDGPRPPYGFDLAGPLAYVGCLRATGRERLLERFVGNNVDNAVFVRSVVLAAPYAALVDHSEDEHYGGSADVVHVFNLDTGRGNLGGERGQCDGPVCSLVQVVLGSDGVSATRTEEVAGPGSGSTEFEAVACAPGSTICVAAALGGDFFTSGDPAAGAGSWSRSEIAASYGGLLTAACPADSLCVGAVAGPGIYTSSDPAGGASTWQPTAPIGGVAEGLACPTTTLCVMSLDNGTIAASTDATGGSSAWKSAQIDPSHVLLGIACSAEPRCFVTDSAGTVFTSSDPTGRPRAWKRSRATPAFNAGACPTSSLCVTVGRGTIATTTAPDAAAWSAQAVPDDLHSVSCPSSSLCVAVGEQGALYVSTDPASGAWSHATIDNGLALNAVSCASASLCVAADQDGHVLTSTNPAGGPSAWTPALIDGDPCSDGHDCSIESIEASDKTGLHRIDSSRLPGSGPFLTGLALNGDTLSWSDDGSPRAVQLTPP
ncbi:MAG: hypothetical protein ACTHMY_30285 [Solirubrobacteraceae bacterium]